MSKCIIVDLDRCIGCYSCELACKVENGIGLGHHWNKVVRMGPVGSWSEDGKTPSIEMYWLPVMCQQCEDAPCVHVCPTAASYRDEDGVVLVDKSKCIGCQYCVMACPYGVRSLNEDEGVVEKCTLCGQLVAVGEDPACVKACCGRARFYGDTDDSTSAAAKALAAADPSSIHELPNVGNNPATKYILSAKTAAWRSDF